MRAATKRLVVLLYCFGWISLAQTQRLFDRFNLTSA